MPHRKSVKHWTPDPLGEALQILAGHTVDSSQSNETTVVYLSHELGGSAVANPDGTLSAVYVTSEPEQIVEMVKNGENLKSLHPRVNCGGLLVTNYPELFRNLNRYRFTFMGTLSNGEKASLISVLNDELRAQSEAKYITESEYSFAKRLLDNWELSDFWDPVTMLAEQPYNIMIDDIARNEGILGVIRAAQLPVVFEGRYVSLEYDEAREAASVLTETIFGAKEKIGEAYVCQALEHYGWDGIFRTSRVDRPRLMIWHVETIRSIGDWRREKPSMSGQKTGLWIPGDRFEAHLSRNRKAVDIRDTRFKDQFIYLSEADLRDLLTVVIALGHGEPSGSERFVWVSEDVLPDILDGKHGSRLRALRTEDVVELGGLIGTVLESIS